jgi:aspartyl-tRNA(Asn)/glutamyl-tRNA(Gln) amidotransferase subunit A
MTLNPDLATLTLSQAADLMQRGALAPVALTEALLQRIAQFNPTLNAYLVVTAETARQQAWSIELGAWSAEAALRPPLLGMPLALKDLFDVAGLATTAGSVIRENAVAAEDAAVNVRLRAAGAILLGKLNMHEWAFGVTTINPHFGPARNPWDLERIPGGSSGGSAAAVAAGLCLASVGSDTGGSVRIPAALCGIVGLKPTYGRVSLRGVVPLSWSLDHAGPITRTVRDAALMLQVVAGHDPDDPASVDMPVDDYLSLEQDVKGLRVGVPREYFFDSLDAEVASAARAAIDELARLGMDVREISLPETEAARQASVTVLVCDAFAYHRDRLREQPDDFGADVRTRLQEAVSISGSDYALARRTQAEWRQRLERLFYEVDILAMATTPIPAPRIDEADAVSAAFSLARLTRPFNLAGVPAISVPCGFTQSGLPIGLQLVSRAWSEATLLRAAYAYEQATAWHTLHPSLDLTMPSDSV